MAFRSVPFLDFVDYDDPRIVENPALRGGLGWEAVHHAFTSTSINLWLPLTLLSHALDFQVYGDWAGGHHLTNVLIHLASSLLLLAWLRRYTGENALSLAVVLLFAVHPLRVESVVWVAERKDVLSLFFYLLTIWFYSARAKAEGPVRRRLYLLSLAAAVLGVLSKPSLMTLPAALILVDFWPLRRLGWGDRRDWPKIRARIVEKIPFLLLALVVAAVAWTTVAGSQALGEPPDLGSMQRAGYASLACLSYLYRTFVPVGLVAYSPYPAGIAPAAFVGGALLLGALSAWALWRHFRSPWLLFGWFWFLGTLLPVSGLVTISGHFAPDRYSYLAHVGLFVALVWGVAMWGRKRAFPEAAKKAVWTIFALVVVALVVLTDRQSRVWRDSETLWRHVLAYSEGDYVAHTQLGVGYLKEGRFEEGVAELEAAIAARPGFSIPLGNLALAMARSGDFEKALRLFDEAGPALPERGRFAAELLSLARASEDAEAITRIVERVIADDPDNVAARIAAGDVLYGAGAAEEALRHYRAAARLDADNARATLSVATVLLQKGASAEALPFLERAAATAPDAPSRAEAYRTLAQAHLLGGAWSEAIASYGLALELVPDRLLIVNEAAQLLLDCPDPALRDPEHALQLAERLHPIPGTPPSQINPRYQRTLVRALIENGRPARAQEAAALGLKAVDTLSGREPLEEPWTPEELSGLRKEFLGLVEATDP